jgi:hypothetical protein
MDNIFTLENPWGFWVISAAVAVIGAGIIIPFLDTYPWLVGVPIGVGGAAVVAAEFIFPGLLAPAPVPEHRAGFCRKFYLRRFEV